MLWRLLLATALYLSATNALYADQVGEFDWSIENVGRVHSVVFDRSVSPDYLYVASDDQSRALVRLDAITGAIQWRRVFPEGDAINEIQLTKFGVLSVSGAGRNVRLWDLNSGLLLWDKVTHIGPAPKDVVFLGLLSLHEDQFVIITSSSLAMIQIQDGSKKLQTFPEAFTKEALAGATVSWQLNLDKTTIFLMAGGHIVMFDLVSGRLVNELIRPEISPEDSIGVEATTILHRDNEQGHVAAVTLTKDQLLFQGLENDDLMSEIPHDSLPLNDERIVAMDQQVSNRLVVILASGKRVIMKISKALQVEVVTIIEAGGIVKGSRTHDDSVLYHVTASNSNASIQVTTYTLSPTVASVSWETAIELAPFGGAISRAFVDCPSTTFDSISSCQAVLVLQDDALVSLIAHDESKGKVQWVREEALANIKSVRWITPAETEIEKQPLQRIPSFTDEVQLEMNRLKLLFKQLLTFSTSLFQPNSPPHGRNQSHIARKEPSNAHLFGFSKLIIVLTESGKLFAIRAEAKTVAWSVFMGPEYHLFVTRDHPALGSGAELLLVSNSRNLVWLDGDTGQKLNRSSAKEAHESSWVVLLPKRKHVASSDEPLARRMVANIAAKSLQVSLYPETSANVAYPELESFYFYRYDKRSNALRGYSIEKKQVNEEKRDVTYRAREAWSIVFPWEEMLVATSHPHEHSVVDSAVTITGDESLLIKYLNPNLVGVATLTTGNDSKTSILYVNLLDSVTGRLIHRARHPHATEPVRMVESENWVVYSFWNALDQRTEMVSLSLFEGAVGTYALNPWKRPSWSSKRSSFDPQTPFLLHKSFIYPTKITSLGMTVTAHGITPSCILVGMETGQIFTLGRNVIDPRQPETPLTPEEQAEGLQMYSPLVPVYNRPTAMLTSNRTVANLKAISTAPAELESTTLVFASGLDLFYVRMTPAKSFDLLPSDFNHEMLLLLCLAFLLSTWITKALAQRKALQLAWQ